MTDIVFIKSSFQIDTSTNVEFIQRIREEYVTNRHAIKQKTPGYSRGLI
jgi:hypothetical protein